MQIQAFLPYLTGGGGAIVVLAAVSWMFFNGQLHSNAEFSKLEQENANLKAALDIERKAVDGAVRTGTVTNQLISALVQVATQKQEGTAARAGTAGLTADDLGP